MHRSKKPLYSITSSARASSVGGTLKTGRAFRATDQSIRGEQRIRNADANLAIVAHRSGMERHEGIFHYVLREGLACSRSSFHKARHVLENCFDQLVDQIVIGHAGLAIVSEGNIHERSPELGITCALPIPPNRNALQSMGCVSANYIEFPHHHLCARDVRVVP